MPDADWLRRRYVEDRAPVSVIAAEAGVDVSTIHRRLRAAGIPPRGPLRPSAPVPEDWLRARLADGTTVEALAHEAGVDRFIIRTRLAELRLLPLTDEQRTRATRAAQAYLAGTSLREIATRAGVSRPTATLWLLTLGVPLRRRGRPARDRPNRHT